MEGEEKNSEKSMGKQNTIGKTEMKMQDVIALYTALDAIGIKIWIDGGWSVDALLERQTRAHKDLDIAVQEKDVLKLREFFKVKGYEQIKEDNKWNFVLSDKKGREIDVHSFIFDDKGNVIEGIMYPATALTGEGKIDGHTVRCISPHYMVEALAHWIHKWPDKYVDAVFALCDKFDIELPREYREFTPHH